MVAQKHDPIPEKIYQQMFDLSPIAKLYLSLTGKVVMVNHQVTALTGYSEQEIIGKSIFEMPFFLPETIKLLKAKFADRLKGKPVAPYDVAVRAKGGKMLVGQTYGKMVKSSLGLPAGVMIVVVDVTEERKTGESLTESKNFYRLLFENTLNGIAYCKIITDKKGEPTDFTYLEVNNAFDKIIGVTGVEGKNVTEVFPTIKKDHPELFEIYGRVAATGKSEHIEFEFRPIKTWLGISVYSPEKGYFVAVFENITDRKKSEMDLKRRVEQSEDMNKLIVGRELKMVELKEKISQLESIIRINKVDDAK